MVVIKNNVMYSCRVFFAGCDLIESGKKGVEALQSPLRARYRGNAHLCEGEEVDITVMPESILFQPTDDSSRVTELHISTLSICAAVRCVESGADPGNMKFVPVHSVITSQEPETDHPAIFAAVMRREPGAPLECFCFICNETRDALHLVNATQFAHSTKQRGYSPSGAMKFFIDQSTEFDRTIRLQSTSGERRTDAKKMYFYSEEYDTRDVPRASVRHHLTSDTDTQNVSRISKFYDDENVVVNGDESRTIYIKAGDYKQETPPPVQESETIVISYNKDEAPPAPTQPPTQTIFVDQPIITPSEPIQVPQPEVIQRKVYIEPPAPPKIEPQKIVVDVPVFKGFPEWDPYPKPIITQNPVVLQPPPPPKPEPQRIIVDKVVVKEWPKCPPAPPPEVTENIIELVPPPYPPQKPQKIIVDKPFIPPIPPPPPPPAPIVEKRLVRVDLPDYPKQEPHVVVVETPVFNPPKPAPRPPMPIIQKKEVFVDPPPFPPQEAQTIILEKPVIRPPGPPPPCPPPKIIEKAVYVDGWKWPEQKPQTIIVEKVIIRDPGPCPPPPPPIIKEKIVYCDAPAWPKQKPQVIVVEKPVFRQAVAPPAPPPVVMEKPVVVETRPPPPPQRQKVIVERPVYKTTYQTRTVPTGLTYERSVPGPAYRSSYVVRSASPQGLRRYAWSDNGEDARFAEQSAFRIYGQPRDFRRTENQFMNERGFAKRLNNEMDLRYSARGPGSYTYGGVRRGSLDS